ncbi:MAG: ribonuclease H family protein [Planctomycetota bacterium]|jgi:ribonuclease HII
MILAGIDEAGLGPTLGPLVVAATALRTPDDWSPPTPWDALSTVVSAKAGRREGRIMVGDSKEVYSKCGTAALERGIFSFLEMIPGGQAPYTRDSLLTVLSARFCEEDCEALAWYRSAPGWSCPDVSADVSPERTEGLRNSLKTHACEVAGLWALPILAPRFNARIDSGLNKSEAVMEQTGTHLLTIAHAFPEEPITITVDKQGGRDRYHPFLLSLFSEYWIDILEEGRYGSKYRIRRESGEICIRFEPKADGNAFCVALSSMIAKYLRERFMHDLNAYFIERLPELKPTAGYPGDAPRFLEEIEGIIEEEGIAREALVRCR